MHQETKEALYMLLDIIESMHRIGGKEINSTNYELVKNEVYSIINNKPKDYNERYIYKDTREDLVGILPCILNDKERFVQNNDVAKFAEYSLGLQLKNWKKKSRNELIGLIIADVLTKGPNELDLFMDAWRNFNKNNKPEERNTEDIMNASKQETNINTPYQVLEEENKEEFLDVWMRFYENYKRGK